MPLPKSVWLGLTLALPPTIAVGATETETALTAPTAASLYQRLERLDRNIEDTQRMELPRALMQMHTDTGITGIGFTADVAHLQQLELQLREARREKAITEFDLRTLDTRRPLASPASMKTVPAQPATTAASRVQPDAEDAPPKSGGHEELLLLNQRIAQFEALTADALANGTAPDAKRVKDRVDVTEKRNEVAKNLGVSVVGTQTSTEIAKRIEGLDREIEHWNRLLGATEAEAITLDAGRKLRELARAERDQLVAAAGAESRR